MDDINASNNSSWNGDVSTAAAAAAAANENDLNPSFVHLRDESRFWVQRVLLPIVGTIGVFGNIVTIVVLTRRGMRSSTNAYLTALAIADVVYLLCVFWLSLKHYPQITDPSMDFYPYTQPYGFWLADASSNTSVWLTVTFTVERYIAVCHPIRGRIFCTESRARRVIVAVYILCFTTTLSTPFEYQVVDLLNPATNTSRKVIDYSDFGADLTYQTIYYWFTSIVFVLLPLSLLIIFNSFLIQSVRQSQALRRSMLCASENDDRAAHNEIRITVTLIAVVMMFLICQLPTASTLIYKIFHKPEANSNEDLLLLALGNFFNFLVTLNAACNFLLYCALSDKYRRTFMSTFCPCLRSAAHLNPSVAYYTQYAASSPPCEEFLSSCQHSRQSSVRRPSTPSNRSLDASQRMHRHSLAPPGNGSSRSSVRNQNWRANNSNRSLRKSVPCSPAPGGGVSPAGGNNLLQMYPVALVPAPNSISKKWWSRKSSSKPSKNANIVIQISGAEDSVQHVDHHQEVTSV